MTYQKWLQTFITEKNVDLSAMVLCSDQEPTQAGNVIQVMMGAIEHEAKAIKATLVKIDFMNGDVMHFINHLAKAKPAKFFEDAAFKAAFG